MNTERAAILLTFQKPNRFSQITLRQRAGNEVRHSVQWRWFCLARNSLRYGES